MKDAKTLEKEYLEAVYAHTYTREELAELKKAMEAKDKEELDYAREYFKTYGKKKKR